MPVYEYQCKKCGDKFEVRRGFFDLSKEKNRCPSCGCESTSRVYSVFGKTASGSSSCAPTPGRKFG
jgi:putative FmdB family regulatory protein